MAHLRNSGYIKSIFLVSYSVYAPANHLSVVNYDARDAIPIYLFGDKLLHKHAKRGCLGSCRSFMEVSGGCRHAFEAAQHQEVSTEGFT